MAAPVDQRQHITSTPGLCGGKPCIAGTRIRVQDIVVRTELGESPDEIVRAYPHITLADVHSALAYYYDHREQIDRQIQQDESFVQQMKEKAGPGLLDRLKKPAGDAEISPR